MDFVSPDVYLKLPESKTKGPYAVTTLPAGSTIYRADPEGKKAPSKGVPNFFGDKASIAHLGRGNPDAFSSYTTTKDLVLFELSFPNLIAILQDESTDEATLEFLVNAYIGQTVMTQEQWSRLRAQGLGTSKETAPETAHMFVMPAVRLPSETGSAYANYTNRALANIICKLGFDGWIAYPGQLIQRNMDMKYYAGDVAKIQADVRAGTVHFAYNVYMPEIVLCDWSAVANRVSGGVRSKTGRRVRKGTRRGRKGRS